MSRPIDDEEVDWAASTASPEWSASAAPVALVRGAQVGRYLILDRVGAGGMGVVYAAHDPDLDRKVALKLLNDARAGASTRARLQREAQALARLLHPNVVAVHDIGTWQGQLFMAMDFVEGGTLRQWLAERPRPWREVLEQCLRAGDGLAAAHATGIVHRDFKPDNVLCGKDGRVCVTDFGIARTSADGEREPVVTPTPPLSSLTRTGAAVGTPAYMPPEQREGHADQRSDQWSYCFTLYEALYGHRPEAVRAGEVPAAPPDARVPLAIHRIILRGLRIPPAERYPSLAGLLGELRRAVSLPARRRRRAQVALAVAVALGAAALVAPRLIRPREWRPAIHELTPVYDEDASGAQFSPDGARLLYVSDREDRDGARRVYLAPTDGGEARALSPPGMPFVRSSIFADGGRSVLFISLHELYRVALPGGAVSRFLQQNYPVADCAGRLVMVENRAEGCPACWALRVRETDGRERERLRIPVDEEVTHLRCERSGQRVLYVLARRGQGPHPTSSIWMLAVDGDGPPVELDREAAVDPMPTFHPDGRSIVFSSARGGATNLWELPLSGGPASQITFGGGPDTAPDIAPDGQHLIFNVEVTSVSIAARTAAGPPRRLTTTLDDTTWIDLAPDGRTLALVVRRAGRALVILQQVDSGEQRILGDGGLPVFSADGRNVVWVDGDHVVSASRDGGGTRVVGVPPGRVTAMFFAADGFIHMALARQAQVQAWRLSFAGGGAEREAPAPYTQVIPAPTGGWRVAFGDSNDLEVVPPGAQPGDPGLLHLPQAWFAWDADGKSFVYADGSTGSYRHDLASGRDEQLGDTSGREKGWTTLRISPDGKTSYGLVQRGQVRRQIITNFGDRPRPP